MTTEYLFDREVELVLRALTPENRRVMQVSLHTGLRVSDVLELRTEQVRKSARFWVTERKTGKRRLIGLPKWLREELLEYAGEYWLFPHRTDPNKHRSRQAVWKDVKRAAAAFRLPQNVAPHSFRKVYAVDLLGKCGDLDKVKRNLNHGSMETTLIYVMAAQLMQQRGSTKAARVGRRFR